MQASQESSKDHVYFPKGDISKIILMDIDDWKNIYEKDLKNGAVLYSMPTDTWLIYSLTHWNFMDKPKKELKAAILLLKD